MSPFRFIHNIFLKGQCAKSGRYHPSDEGTGKRLASGQPDDGMGHR